MVHIIPRHVCICLKEFQADNSVADAFCLETQFYCLYQTNNVVFQARMCFLEQTKGRISGKNLSAQVSTLKVKK